MKCLKNFFPILMLFIVMSGFEIMDPFEGRNVNENRIEVIFDRTLKFNDLVKIKLDLSEKGIVLDYNKLEFDENGGLKTIDFNVDFKDGFSGHAAKTPLTNQSKFGFFRDYAEGAVSPFGTGNIE